MKEDKMFCENYDHAQLAFKTTNRYGIYKSFYNAGDYNVKQFYTKWPKELLNEIKLKVPFHIRPKWTEELYEKITKGNLDDDT